MLLLLQQLRVNRSEGEVRSIELRLMRIESSSYFNKQGFDNNNNASKNKINDRYYVIHKFFVVLTTVSEIQNIQIADGDVCR